MWQCQMERSRQFGSILAIDAVINRGKNYMQAMEQECRATTFCKSDSETENEGPNTKKKD